VFIKLASPQGLLFVITHINRHVSSCSMVQEFPIGISNRHVHLSPEHIELLFGKGYVLKVKKHIRQPGQFATEETVTLLGKNPLEARIVGPPRKESQIEILKADQEVLGMQAPERVSGTLEGTPGIVLQGPKGKITLPYGVIIAAKHLHLSEKEAKEHGFTDVAAVDLQTTKGITFKKVAVRSGNMHLSEFHLDKDDAVKHGVENSQTVKIIKMYKKEL